jgi:hypothetical protein
MSRLFMSVGIAAVLSATAWLNLHWAETTLDISPIVVKSAPAVLDANGNPDDVLNAALAPGADLSETLSRPLFHQSRRPFTPAPVADLTPVVVEEIPKTQSVEGQQRAVPELRLAGISISGDGAHALLGPANGAEMRWYSQGDDVDGWSIAEITSEAVTLAIGESAFIVSLYPPAARGSN